MLGSLLVQVWRTIIRGGIGRPEVQFAVLPEVLVKLSAWVQWAVLTGSYLSLQLQYFCCVAVSEVSGLEGL